jgi:hypothetical protein
MTQKQSSDLTKYILDPIGFTNYVSKPMYNFAYAPRDAARAVSDLSRDKATGDAVVRAALGGLGLGVSGSRLYHLIQTMNKPKETHTKFGPGAKTVDDSEKIAESLVDTLRQLYANTTHGIGKAVSGIHPTLAVPATIGAAVTGLYGGSSLINSIEDKKRKEEQADMVEDAKKDYQRALMGKKHAAAFDAAFTACTEKNALNLVDLLVRDPLNALQLLPYGDAAASMYATGTLGAGALAGKMTYDWTRARSKDKALEKARKSRARIEGAAPLYIDPEQLAAIKKLAD